MTVKKLNNFLALVLALVLAVGLLPTQASAATADFADVPATHWAYTNVMWARQNGVVDGVGNNRFEPDGRVANNAMVKMIVSAFFSSEYAAYEVQNRNAISAYFSGNPSWDGGMNYYAKQNRLLDGVNMDIGKPASANASMSRYDMALLLANVLKLKGITVTQSDKDLAAAELRYIGHYYDIPETYRDVVLTVYASGLINGKGNDGFCGKDNMTRAEACTVILRLDKLVTKGGGTATDPDPIVTPTPDVPAGPKDIQVTTNTNASANNAGYGSMTGTSYTITDNGFGTGRLNNGKEINEANIAELLEKAKTIWPNDMRWTDSGAGNNWYASPSAIVTTALSRATTGATKNISTQYGCGGFAALISDYLFGKTGNPAHVVTNFDDIRPGDIIVQMQGTTARHVMIVTGINQTASSREGYVFCSDGNRSNVINWSKTTSAYSWGPDQLSAYGSYVALSRWPESAPGTGTSKPETPSVPSGPKDIQVTTTSATDSKGVTGTAYNITDNGFPSGYLNNGMPINETNVVELLNKAKTIWHDGMTWTSPGTANNNWYTNLGTVAKSIPNLHGNNENYECSGFAVMLSDYLFGKSNNPWHVVTNPADIRPGDIIVSTSQNHSMVAMDTVKSGSRAGAIFVAEGNYGKVIRWSSMTNHWDAIMPSDFGTYTIYSRYPA